MSTHFEVLKLAERAEMVLVLCTAQEDGDPTTAVGQLYALAGAREKRHGAPKMIASTNDDLGCLWVSPSESIWMAGPNGNVGTTAKLRWPAPHRPDLSFGNDLDWSLTSLPPVTNISVLWGTSDADVHAGTYGGHLFHWDGNGWERVFEGAGNGKGTIRAIRGGGPKDVFAVGIDKTLLHYDGATWSAVRLPALAGLDAGHFSFTAIHPLPSGETLILGDDRQVSFLLKGSAESLFELGRYTMTLIDMAGIGERVLFAAGAAGVAELFGTEVRTIRDTFKTATLSAGADRWYFTEPAPPKPGFIEYNPAFPESPWRRNKF